MRGAERLDPRHGQPRFDIAAGVAWYSLLDRLSQR